MTPTTEVHEPSAPPVPSVVDIYAVMRDAVSEAELDAAAAGLAADGWRTSRGTG